MKRIRSKGLVVASSVALASLPSIGQAQAAPQTPRNWSYEVDKSGNRVARTDRLVKPDGSWREEIRQGNCVTVKERSATGEYKETRQCNSATPK